MRYQIPLKPIPSQQVVTQLNGITYTIIIRQLAGRQYFSVSQQGKILCQNVLMVNRSYLIGTPYMEYYGDFMVIDLQGNESPEFTGWGNRFVLVWDYNG